MSDWRFILHLLETLLRCAENSSFRKHENLVNKFAFNSRLRLEIPTHHASEEQHAGDREAAGVAEEADVLERGERHDDHQRDHDDQVISVEPPLTVSAGKVQSLKLQQFVLSVFNRLKKLAVLFLITNPAAKPYATATPWNRGGFW